MCIETVCFLGHKVNVIIMVNNIKNNKFESYCLLDFKESAQTQDNYERKKLILIQLNMTCLMGRL